MAADTHPAPVKPVKNAKARHDAPPEHLNSDSDGGPLTLTMRLVRQIRRLIIEGELIPGHKVPQQDLCRRFGVSRTPLREALKYLASEGLLVVVPNRGLRVAELTQRDVDEAVALLGGLERMAVPYVIRAITDAQIAEIGEAHYRMVGHYARGEINEYFLAAEQVHELIVGAAGNRLLLETYRNLFHRIMVIRYRSNTDPERWAQAVAEHERIFEALKARDEKALEQALTAHRGGGWRHLKDHPELVHSTDVVDLPTSTDG